ncbi:hypothetical protein AWC31_14520 [Mycolicibacterium wolinskyi]|uniref:Uncharacterized protein n=1 Tax=Mycolicibacterium wolinskyi TaxID=59750 RepID=A0A1X2FJA0_9MYCO|nr:hypothetical protein AWC31_14520 [Mycolicibacterium wolinskyi]
MQAWSPRTAAQAGPAHTWIPSWSSDIAQLRTAVKAAGWQWYIAERVRRDASVVAAVSDVLTRRARHQTPRNMPGQPHVLLAIGPDVPWNLPELMRIALLGRAHDVHLAVSAAHRTSAGRHHHYPIEFVDNITGWYSRGRKGQHLVHGRRLHFGRNE